MTYAIVTSVVSITAITNHFPKEVVDPEVAAQLFSDDLREFLLSEFARERDMFSDVSITVNTEMVLRS